MKKIRESSGITWITFLVLILTILLSGLFIWDGYMAHLDNARMIFDQTQVAHALNAAKVEFMQESFPAEGVTYYFDAEGSRLTDWSQIAQINGYGRSDEKHNRRGETGAEGIPNLGGKDGAQLLAISIEDENTYTLRWQGHRLTYYDYSLMTEREKSRLSKEQWSQIEMDIEKNGLSVDEITEDLPEEIREELEGLSEEAETAGAILDTGDTGMEISEEAEGTSEGSE